VYLFSANNVNNVLSELRAHLFLNDPHQTLPGGQCRLLLVPREQHLELLLLVVPPVVLRDGHNDWFRETEVAGEDGPTWDCLGYVDQLLPLQMTRTNCPPQ
jgi:hypothetical protein